MRRRLERKRFEMRANIGVGSHEIRTYWKGEDLNFLCTTEEEGRCLFGREGITDKFASGGGV